MEILSREILTYFPHLILVQVRMSERCYIPLMSASCAYSLLLNVSNTNTPSGLCSRYKLGGSQQSAFGFISSTQFCVLLEHKAGKPGKFMYLGLFKNNTPKPQKPQHTQRMKRFWMQCPGVLELPAQQGPRKHWNSLPTKPRLCFYLAAMTWGISKRRSCFKWHNLTASGLPVHKMMPLEHTLTVLVQPTQQRAK